MNVSELARATGLSPKTLHNWISNAPPRDLTQVRKVARYFGLSIEELCFGEAETTANEKLGIDGIEDGEWISGVFEIKIRKVKQK